MQAVTTIGLDIAKSVFQVHGLMLGKVVVRRQLKRRYLLAFFKKLSSCLGCMEDARPAERRTLDGRRQARVSIARYRRDFTPTLPFTAAISG